MAKLNMFFLHKKIIQMSSSQGFTRCAKIPQDSYACLRPEATKCEFHNRDLEIKRHLQETICNRRLARKAVRNWYTLEKFLEEAEEFERNEKEIRLTETEDANFSVNKIRVGNYRHVGKRANHPPHVLCGTPQGKSQDKKQISNPFLFLHVFNTPFCTFSYFTYFYFLVLYLDVCKILSSLLSLIMTKVQSKRLAFFPIIFTSICFKKPLPIRTSRN